MSKDEALKPCPFCGSGGDLITDRMTGGRWVVICRGLNCTVRTRGYDSAEDARVAWNTRTPTNEATTEALEEAIAYREDCKSTYGEKHEGCKTCGIRLICAALAPEGEDGGEVKTAMEDSWESLYLQTPPSNNLLPLVNMLKIYHKTTTKKTACRDWKGVRDWATARNYSEKGFDRANRLALAALEGEKS